MSRKNSIHRVHLGGSYVSDSRNLRPSNRYWIVPEYRFWYLGFRIVVIRRKQ
jgi:formylglycine-generating enzyme required for sulfatase activity